MRRSRRGLSGTDFTSTATSAGSRVELVARATCARKLLACCAIRSARTSAKFRRAVPRGGIRRPRMRARPSVRNLPTLQHFVLRSEARKLYREVLRAIRGVEPDTAAGVRLAAREQFAAHADEMDIERIRVLLVDGKHSLEQMRGALGTSRVAPPARPPPEPR